MGPLLTSHRRKSPGPKSHQQSLYRPNSPTPKLTNKRPSVRFRNIAEMSGKMGMSKNKGKGKGKGMGEHMEVDMKQKKREEMETECRGLASGFMGDFACRPNTE